MKNLGFTAESVDSDEGGLEVPDLVSMKSYGPLPIFNDESWNPYPNLNDKTWTPYPYFNDKSWTPYPSFSDNRHEDFQGKGEKG